MKKLLLFLVPFGLWLGGDLWTKHWADTHLGDAYHPLVVRVGEADAGRTVSDLIAQRFDVPATEVEADWLPRTRKLDPKLEVSPEAPVFAGAGPLAQQRSFYAFWREDKNLPPRRVDKVLDILLPRWLALAAPGADPAKRRALVRKALGEVTLGQWLAEKIPVLDVEDARRVELYAVPRVNRAPGPKTRAHAGDLYVIQRRVIDVAGDWFKLVYAENTGAAFGMFKGLPHTLRYTLFFGLTSLAFLFIGVMAYRMPHGANVVLVGLGTVLAGAAGNFVNRLEYRYVIDFLDMDLGFMHWPTYNVADIAIAVGVFLLLGDILLNKDSALAPRPQESASEGS